MSHVSAIWASNILLIIVIFAQTSIATAQVEHKEQMSSKRAFFSPVQANNKLYFVGGFEGHDFIASTKIDVFNLGSNTWDPSINLTTPRGQISTAVLGNKIYMVGGNDFSSVPFQYMPGQFNFSNVGFTSGPTVRRPVRLSLHNSVLTVIGYFSVDFLDTASKRWTHNQLLTDVMSNLYDTTTVAHLNFVFVIGGVNSTSREPSTSIWMINSTTSTPTEVKNITSTTSKQFVGSWFDDNHGALVTQFYTKCIVLHVSSQTWLVRDTHNNSLSSVSYQNNTIVFFTDGYWTIDWHTMTDTWTPLAQITFAFTVDDQLVFCAGGQMSVVTPTAVNTQNVTSDTIALSRAMSSSVYVLVTSTANTFMYFASTQQLKLVDMNPAYTPFNIFRSNDSLVHIIGQGDLSDGVFGLNALASFDASGTLLRKAYIKILPDVLVEDYFFNFTKSVSVRLQSPGLLLSSISVTAPVWIQQGNSLFVMSTAPLSSSPPIVRSYNAVDVYNYVDQVWENSIPFPNAMSLIFSDPSFIPVAVLNDTLCMIVKKAFFCLNDTGGWNGLQPFFAGPMIPRIDHPTYVPVVVLDDMAYICDFGAGLFITSIAMGVRRTSSSIAASSKQAVHTDKQIMLSLSSTLTFLYSNIALYDIATDTWATTLLPTSDTMVSIVLYDDYLLAFGDDTTAFNYMDPQTLKWYNQPFNNTYVPASMFVLESNRSTLVIAGGYDRTGFFYIDEVQFVTLDLTATRPIEPSQPLSVLQPTSSPVSDDSTTVVVAVVVTIGAAVIAGVLLAVLLTRHKQKRKRATSATTIGLEQQFGQWFVPFKDIRFDQQVGQGADGQVFKGKWKNTDVALKMSMTQANQSVISELSLMINMRPHPNVVQLFGFSVNPETNSIILILEYCNGGSLDTVLYSGDNIKIETKLYWLKNICKGISHLHANNLVHRDIAARNVMLHQGEPKLTDFGMTRVVDQQQQHGTTKSELGPIRWMAPESLKSKTYSPKSDVWSYGILMFEVLAQQEPHVEEDPIDIGRRIRDEGLTPQLPVTLECLSDFSSIMNLCCVVDSNFRPSIEQVLEKLEHIPV